MSRQSITFREMLAPLPAEEFFDGWKDRRPIHLPGGGDKFASLFSWREMNRLLDMANVWSGRTMKIVMDGNALASESFCRPVYNREGERAMQADPARVRRRLRDGATMVLDFIESFSPSVASVCAALQVWFGGPATCNLYCSWEERQGFRAHFDTTDVVVLQIAGRKTWRVYTGRFENPVDLPGYETTGFPQDRHEQNKGDLLAALDMTPGDLLYLPRGQYHEALAAGGGSLHLTFDIGQATGHDLLANLQDRIMDDPLFRMPMPSFDDARAHDAHLRRLADRARDLVRDPDATASFQKAQRQRAFLFCYPEFGLPDRGDPVLYRVRGLAARLDGGALRTLAGVTPLESAEASLAEWILARDFFEAGELDDRPNRTAALATFAEAGLIERI